MPGNADLLIGVFVYPGNSSPGARRLAPEIGSESIHASPLEATLVRFAISVASKGVTGNVNPLETTLTENREKGAPLRKPKSPHRARE
jgi:hypothetical protein